MMHPRHVLVDLPKDRRPELYCFGLAAKEAKRGALHLLGKSKLCSRKNAHRRCRIFRCGKPSCTGPEVDCRKLLTDLSRPGFDVVQTIVAHGSGTPMVLPPTPFSSLRKNLETEPMFSQVRVEFWRWIELWSLRCGLRRAQFGDADQIVGDQVEQEIGSNSGDAAVLGLTHCTVLFAPAEDAFGHRPAQLRDAVALVPRGASVDGAAATLAG